MELREVPQLIRKWFKLATIVLAAKCSVEYSGRAASSASSAWRLVIIKEDGTILIHGPEGRNPVNWQPKAHITARLEGDGRVVIEALRLRPREVLRIYVERDVDVMVVRLGRGRFLLHGSERELTEYIALNPSIIEKGAQLVSREVSTPHGRIDVVLRSRDGNLIVVEVKRGVADIDAVYQLGRYVRYYESLGVRVKGVLASPSLSPNARKALAEMGFKHVKVDPDVVKHGLRK